MIEPVRIETEALYDDGALRHTLDDLILEHNASASSQTLTL